MYCVFTTPSQVSFHHHLSLFYLLALLCGRGFEGEGLIARDRVERGKVLEL